MSDKKPVPPALAEFALEQLAEAGEQAAIDLTVQNVEILRAEIERRDARIAELEAQVSDIRLDVITQIDAHAVTREKLARYVRFESLYAESERELAALKAQPSVGVVMPKRAQPKSWNKADIRNADTSYIDGWNDALDEVAQLNPCRAQAVPDGWRVMMCTSSITRDGDRWEVYSPGGSGGVVSTHDVKDQTVWMLLDALAAAPSAQPGDGVNWKAVAGEQKTIIEGLQARLNPSGECVAVPRELLERPCPKMDARHWHQWNASEAYQAACELRALLAQQGKAVGDE